MHSDRPEAWFKLLLFETIILVLKVLEGINIYSSNLNFSPNTFLLFWEKFGNIAFFWPPLNIFANLNCKFAQIHDPLHLCIVNLAVYCWLVSFMIKLGWHSFSQNWKVRFDYFTSPLFLASSMILMNFLISPMVGPVKSSTGMRVHLSSGNA